MFQTEINLALQSLASPGLTWLLSQISATGYNSFVIGLIVAIMLGLDLRKGFLLLQIIAWTAMVSEICKQLFGLPRPFFADARVACLEKGWNAATPFTAMGGESFFALPARAVVDAFRLQGLSFGFPSGHVSGGIAMWGGLAMVFRSRILGWLAPFMVALLAFSRMYLGMHFLADVISGTLLGSLMLFFAYLLVGRDESRRRFFSAMSIKRTLPGIAVIVFMFILPLLLAFFSLITAVWAGFFIGLNAAFILAWRSGISAEGGSLSARVVRVLLGGLFFLLLSWVLPQVLTWLHVPTGAWSSFLTTGLGCFLTFWGLLQLFLRLGLYKKETPWEAAR
jgi:membrane-associated phospholipid phosphatase